MWSACGRGRRCVSPRLLRVGVDNAVIPDAVLGDTSGHPAVLDMPAAAVESVTNGEDAWHSGPGVSTRILRGRDDVLLLPPGRSTRSTTMRRPVCARTSAERPLGVQCPPLVRVVADTRTAATDSGEPTCLRRSSSQVEVDAHFKAEGCHPVARHTGDERRRRNPDHWVVANPAIPLTRISRGSASSPPTARRCGPFNRSAAIINGALTSEADAGSSCMTADVWFYRVT